MYIYDLKVKIIQGGVWGENPRILIRNRLVLLKIC